MIVPGPDRTFLAIRYKPLALILVISRSNPNTPSLAPFCQEMAYAALLVYCVPFDPGLLTTKNAEAYVICHIKTALTAIHIEERLRIGRTKVFFEEKGRTGK